MQHIDTRCLNAGEDFVVAGSFKLLNSTGHGASCFDTGEDIENDPEKCPTVRMIGRNCDNDDVDFQIQNELGIVQGWEPENFNDFNTRITISQDLSTCQEVVIMAGYKITTEKDILSKSMNMIPATASPTNSPHSAGNCFSDWEPHIQAYRANVCSYIASNHGCNSTSPRRRNVHHWRWRRIRCFISSEHIDHSVSCQRR